MKHTIRSLFSLGLALGLLFSLGGNSAFAAENISRPTEVKASGENLTRSYGSVSAVIDDALSSNNALGVNAEHGHTAEVSADSISAGGGFPTALFLCGSDSGGRSQVTVANGISASGKDTAFGVSVSTFDGGAAVLRVNGGGIEARSDEYAFGLHARSFGPGSIDLNVSGDVTASGGTQARAVFLAAPESGSLRAEVNGKVSASGGSDSAGAEIELGEDSGGSLLFRVNGDLSCSKTALTIRNASPRAQATIVVDGTIKGGVSSVKISDRENTANLRLFAWKISRDDQGNTVSCAGGPAGELQKTVGYIIHASAPAGVTLRVAGVSYEQELGIYTATEGSQITLYPEAESGKIAAVYNGDYALKEGDDGGYSLTVPRGGGVELRVELA